MTKINLDLIVPVELAGLRLDQAIAQLVPDYSRARITDWIKAGQVAVNGKVLKPKDKVQAEQHIKISAEIVAAGTWDAEELALEIVYEDDAILIINKAAGVVVHPAPGNYSGTLVNALLHHAPELKLLPRAGVIHRIDKDTTGLLVVAKTLAAHTFLVDQLQQRKFERKYLALVQGKLITGATIEAPIGRHPQHRTKMAVIESGKPAITHYSVKQRLAEHTLVEVKLETGRTHQIRVHFAHIKHPVVGDPAYTGRNKLPPNLSAAERDCILNFKRQALHAAKLGLEHPVTHEWLEWQVDLPQDFQELLSALA